MALHPPSPDGSSRSLRQERGRTAKASTDKSETDNSRQDKEEGHDVIQKPWRDEDENASSQGNDRLEMSNSKSHPHVLVLSKPGGLVRSPLSQTALAEINPMVTATAPALHREALLSK
jgi:hypothetical protein